jgi:hypothetical protein
LNQPAPVNFFSWSNRKEQQQADRDGWDSFEFVDLTDALAEEGAVPRGLETNEEQGIEHNPAHYANESEFWAEPPRRPITARLRRINVERLRVGQKPKGRIRNTIVQRAAATIRETAAKRNWFNWVALGVKLDWTI